MELPGPKATVDAAPRRSWGLGRVGPIAVLAAGLVAFLAFGLHEHVTFETLSGRREALLDWVDRYGALAPFLFGLTYATAVAFSLPIGVLLTITGGFLFGPVVGTTAVVVGATIGATLLFLAARTAFGRTLRAKAGATVERMAKGFEEDAFSYLLFLRLVPIFPFWLVNIAPAFTKVPLRTYVLATAIGIVPGAFVYALVGNGLGAVFDVGDEPDFGLIFRPEIIAPIIGLALLALVPVVYKRVRRGRTP